MPLLDIAGLTVTFSTDAQQFIAVDDVDLAIDEGEVVGIVGESGSGKSVMALSLLGLIDFPGRVGARRMAFAGHDLRGIGDRERRQLVGNDIAMSFQDPLASLDPCYAVAHQLMEALAVHGTERERTSRSARRARALELLQQVEIPDAAARLDAYPHQLSGGMAQRVMIAMAISCKPRLLIADEPTTALDVTVQAQVLDLLLRIQSETQMALMLITHDLAIVAETAHRVIVLYAGQEVETGPLPEVFETPAHPYTQALLAALPATSRDQPRLQAIPGVVPGAHDRPSGCLLSPRCRYAVARCHRQQPALMGPPGRGARCHFRLDAHGHPTGTWQAERDAEAVTPT